MTPEVAKEPKLAPNFINNAFNLKEETEAFINYREVKQTWITFLILSSQNIHFKIYNYALYSKIALGKTKTYETKSKFLLSFV